MKYKNELYIYIIWPNHLILALFIIFKIILGSKNIFCIFILLNYKLKSI